MRRASSTLSPEGLVYLLAPFRLRLELRRRLRSRGLEFPLRIVHRPHWKDTRYLIPLRSEAIRFAYSVLLPSNRLMPDARGTLHRAAESVGMGSFLPGVAEVAARPGGRVPMEWLAHVPADGTGQASGVVRMKLRGTSGKATIFRLPPGAKAPSHVVKAAFGDDAGPGGEGVETLSRLRGAAVRSGARLPDVVDVSRNDLRVETTVRGKPASVLLSSTPSRLRSLLEEIARWLRAWHRRSRRTARLDRAALHRHLLSPAAAVLRTSGVEREYRDWLGERAEAMAGCAVPVVATHNDLSMENIVLAEGQPLGVVDWDTGEEGGLPLVDFYYSVVEATTAAERGVDRAQALRDCFTSEGRHRRFVLDLEAKIAVSIGVTPEFRTLCFHACWLRHAAGEREKHGRCGTGSFQDVVRWLSHAIAAGRGPDVSGA